jgi:hypothetical protein
MNDPATRIARAGAVTSLRAFLNRPLAALILLSMVTLALAYQVPVVVDLSQPGIVLTGFYDLEGRSSPRPYHWTDGHARVWLAGMGRQPFRVVLTLSSARPNSVALPTVTVLAGDATLGSFKAPRPVRDFPLDVNPDSQSIFGDLDIHIDSETFVPPDDLRTLGVILYGLRVEPADGQPHAVWPAPLPLIWGTLLVSLLFLSTRAWSFAAQLAWPVSLLVLAVLCGGVAVARLLTVATLPWGVLVTSAMYAVSVSAARRGGRESGV